MIFLSHRERGRNRDIYQKLRREGVDVAFRRGLLRVSPHVYNTEDDIDRALAVLAA